MQAARDAEAGAAEPVRTLRLFEAAERHGAYRWAEQRLFGLTGSWAAAPGLPDAARVHLFEASAQHAWHAELWAARLPVLAGVDPDELTRPAGPGAAALLDALGPGGTGTPEGGAAWAGRRFFAALAGVVLPRLLASYHAFSRHLVPATDGPSIRALALVVADIESELTTLGAHLSARGGAGLGERSRADEATMEQQEWERSLASLVGESSDGLFSWKEPEAAG